MNSSDFADLGQIHPPRSGRVESITLAVASLHGLNEERNTAVNNLIDATLVAYIAGEPLEQIMEAAGFPPDDLSARPKQQGGLIEVLTGEQGPTNQAERFAEWIGRSLATRIVERAKGE